MSTEGSTRTVVAALLADLGIATTKVIARGSPGHSDRALAT